jgi:hypothetical protein
MMKAAPLTLFSTLFLLCLSNLIPQAAAQIDDVIEGAASQGLDAWERLAMAGRCHSTVGTVWLTTYLDEGVLNPSDYSAGQPSGKKLASGPELLHRKDLQNWDGNDGDWCDGKDPIPYPLPANSSASWIIGEKDGGLFAPELFMYFQVVDPAGNPTPCLLNFYQDITRDYVTITLQKSAECNSVDAAKNLKIVQSGVYCSRVVDMGYNGKVEQCTRIGNSEGDCPASNRIPGTGEYENKSVYYSSFSVYWDPVPGTTAEAVGFVSNTTFGPAAAPAAASLSLKTSSVSTWLVGAVISAGLLALC